MSTSITFRERMAGHVAFGQEDFNEGLRRGRKDGCELALDLEIDIPDVDAFLADPEHAAPARGTVRCGPLGGRLPIEAGTFQLFVEDPRDARRKRMRYVLRCADREGRPVCVAGFKEVVDGPGLDVWQDTTTLFVRLHAGPDPTAPVTAAGIARISHAGFARQLLSMRARGGSPWARARALTRFQAHFAGELRHAYGGRSDIADRSDFPDFDPLRGHPEGAWHDVPGHAGLRRRILELEAGDGRWLTLHQVRGASEPTASAVLCLHGAGVRGDLFLGPPGGPSLARSLADAGHDVWILNWRASMDLPPSSWWLDEAAVHDHPRAIERVLAETGRERLDVLAHCQGATSFTMTALAGLAPQVDRVVLSAVSLCIAAPWRTKLKGLVVLPLVSLRMPYVNAQWGVRPPTMLARGVATLARMVRRECDDPVCALGNYMYGTGPDVLWVHDNLSPETHEWVAREFGYAPTKLLRQMARSARRGRLLPRAGIDRIPRDLRACAIPDEQTWTFVAGTRNRLYPPEGQRRSLGWAQGQRPGRDGLVELEGYGHLDPLFGKDAVRDAHPAFVHALRAPEAAGATATVGA